MSLTICLLLDTHRKNKISTSCGVSVESVNRMTRCIQNIRDSPWKYPSERDRPRKLLTEWTQCVFDGVYKNRCHSQLLDFRLNDESVDLLSVQ